MADDPNPLQAAAKAALIAVPAVGAAVWGALGGATNALVIRVTILEAVRHIAIGAAVAAGLGGIAAPILTHWLNLPAGAITGADGAAGGSLAYLTCSLDYDGHISRRGDRHLRGLLYEAATVILTRARADSALRSWGLKLRARVGFKRAAVAVARKLSVIMHRMLTTGETFDRSASVSD